MMYLLFLRANLFRCILTVCLVPFSMASAEEFSEQASPSSLVDMRMQQQNPSYRGQYDLFPPAGSLYSLAENPDEPRSDFWKPFGSFLLPGLGQWIDGQAEWGAIYSGVAAGGLIWASSIARSENLAQRQEDERQAREEAGEEEMEGADLMNKDNDFRKVTLGGLMYQGAGGMSAYHAFRTSVRSRKRRGQYQFLTQEETPADIFYAPLRFEYLKRPSTYVPILIAASLASLTLASEPDPTLEKDNFGADDAFFATAYSLNAGTHEEAMFRGWLQPLVREYWFDDFWSNIFSTSLFALAHLGSTSTPVAQALLGYHLGDVTIRNNYTISESVFIHTWWDIIIFTATFHYKRKAPGELKNQLNPVLWLPPLQIAF